MIFVSAKGLGIVSLPRTIAKTLMPCFLNWVFESVLSSTLLPVPTATFETPYPPVAIASSSNETGLMIFLFTIRFLKTFVNFRANLELVKIL